MVDRELLEAIGTMMDQKLATQMGETQKLLAAQMEETKSLLAAQKAEILNDSTHSMKVLLETEVQTQFNLLAERQEAILQKMTNEEDIDIMDGRLDILETIVKKHSREIAALKAN